MIEGDGRTCRAEATTERDQDLGAESGSLVFDSVQINRGPNTAIGPVSFEVHPGEVVALTGRSGSGKSSMVAALLGFLSPAAGSITGPSHLAWVGQQPGLLQGSVAENVALGDTTPNLERVRRALDSVGLTELDAQHTLGAQGAGLSGGQAQRVSIARALYRAWTIGAGALVLDEPSSALDRESETLLAETLRNEAAQGRAVLLVSHRPALIDQANRVVQMEEIA